MITTPILIDDTVPGRLQALCNLQVIHSRLDRIRQIRGGLPEEVRDLEDELEGLRFRLDNLKEEVAQAQGEIATRNTLIAESKDLIKKYEAQLMTVRNNREHEALSKEIELAHLDILTGERKITQFRAQIEEKDARIAEVQRQFDERQNDLAEKNKELEALIEETQAEENKMLELAAVAERNIESRFLTSYLRVRKNMRNGLAVVTMDRGACGGCFAIIPPQRAYEIRQRKKIIVCENCGRILADETFFEEARATQVVEEHSRLEP